MYIDRATNKKASFGAETLSLPVKKKVIAILGKLDSCHNSLKKWYF